jgi:dethiobiotin synthetase
LNFFITSTGTEIGKTYVATHLCREMITTGKTVNVLKPIISGFDDDTMPECDSAHLLRSIGQKPTFENISAISPWRFEAPISPDMAARRENRKIEFSALVDFCHQALDEPADYHLIEGVGGAMVPLDEQHTVLDWIEALNITPILVTGSYLGSLSHILTTAAAIQTRNVVLAAIVVNESEVSPVPLAETIETLERFLPDQKILALPRIKNGDGESLLNQII